MSNKAVISHRGGSGREGPSCLIDGATSCPTLNWEAPSPIWGWWCRQRATFSY
jgi:hypothetical protein